MKYELMGNGIVKRFNDDETITSIPADETNSDYQTYLAHVDSEGNK